MKRKDILVTVLLLLFVAAGTQVFGADRYWVSATASNWNNTANWSTTSGGAGGASVPGSGDVAIFNGASGKNGNCDLDINITVQKIQTTSGYSGTIKQNGKTITIGSGGMALAGGTFTGDSLSITITSGGNYNNSGCAFTSTKGTFDIQAGDFKLTGSGSFTHNNGLVKLSLSSGTDTCNLDISTSSATKKLYDLDLNAASGSHRFTFNTANPITAERDLIISGNGIKLVNTGNIEVTRNATISGTGAVGGLGGVGTIKFIGNAKQTFTGNGVLTGNYILAVEIAKTGDTLHLANDIAISFNWTLTSGNFNAGTSKLYFPTTSTITFFGNFTRNNAFNKIYFGGGTGQLTFVVNDTVEVRDSIIVPKPVVLNKGTNSGILAAKGTLYIPSNGYFSTNGGTGTLLISGNGTQRIVSNHSSSSAYHAMPKLNIMKSSGDTLIFIGHIKTSSQWTYTSGIINGDNAHFYFINRNNSITGSHALKKVHLVYSTVVSGSVQIYITSGTELTVTDSLWIDGASHGLLETGTINAKGAIVVTNTSTIGSYAAAAWGTGKIRINGSGNQNFTGASSLSTMHLPNIEVDKSAGTLYLSNIIHLGGSWTRTNGAVDAGTSTVAFARSGTVTIAGSGSHTFNNLTFPGTYTTTTTVASGSTLTVNGTINIDGSSSVVLNTGTIEAKGNIIVNNTNTSGGGGSATILINGTGTQNFTDNGTVGSGNLCRVTINKTSGTLNLDGIISVKNNWTYTAGTLNVGSSTLAVCATSTVTGSHTLNNFTLAPTAASTVTIASGTTLTLNGTYATSGTVALTVNTGSIHAKGNISIGNTSTSLLSGGTATLTINGGSTQNFYGNTTIAGGGLCNVVINKSGGTLNLFDNITAMKDWTYTAGTIDPGSSTVIFYSVKTISGSHTLNNVKFYGGTFTIGSGTTITSTGILSFDGVTTNFNLTNGGVLEAKGDIQSINTHTLTTGGGTTTILINGSGNQTFTGSGIAGTGYLPKVEINKSSGTLTLASIICSNQDWIYMAGTVDAGSSTVWFRGAFNLDGQGSSATMTFNNVIFGGSTIRTLTGNLFVSKDITINASSTLSAGSNIISLGRDWINNGTWAAGTSTLKINGSGYQSFNKASAALETFPNVTLAKTGGSLTLNCPLKITTDFTLIQGKIRSTSTNYLELNDNITYPYKGSDSGYVSGPVRKIGNDPFTFPLGDTTLTTGAYHPLEITAPGSTTDNFEARYYASAYSPLTPLDDSLENLSTCEYFTLQRRAGSSSITPSISWNSNWCNDNYEYTDLRVAQWSGSQWLCKGNGGVSASTSGTTGLIAASQSSSFATLTPILIGHIKTIPKRYATLSFKPDHNFYAVEGNLLRFKYVEEYKDGNGKMNIKVYRLRDNKIVYNNSTFYNSFTGDNRVNFNLLSMTGGAAAGYYMLEVTNDKNEKQYLKFKI